MKNLLLVLSGVLLGAAASALAHDPSECPPCPPAPPCVAAPTPEAQKAIEDAKAALDAARKGPQTVKE